MQEIPLDVQNTQMEIAVQQGLIRREQEQGRLNRTSYVFNSEYLPVLKRVLPDYLKG
jgi:hypothetical protein